MTLYFSKTTTGFYHSDIHEKIPEDSVEITQEEHSYLLAGQGSGKIIIGDDNGKPILINP